jgi:hypothetical protein
MQWKAIWQMSSKLNKISTKNIRILIEQLQTQISTFLRENKQYRPDGWLVDAIKLLKKIYLSIGSKSVKSPTKNQSNGKQEWETWLKDFSKKHWRLRNIRAAMLQQGIEMKKVS